MRDLINFVMASAYACPTSSMAGIDRVKKEALPYDTNLQHDYLQCCKFLPLGRSTH